MARLARIVSRLGVVLLGVTGCGLDHSLGPDGGSLDGGAPGDARAEDAPLDSGADRDGGHDAGADGGSLDAGADGGAPDCTVPYACSDDERPTIVFATDFPGTLTDVTSIAIDDAGGVVLAGWFTGELDFGDGPLTATGANDLFVTRLDPMGAPEWTQPILTSADDGVLADIALDSIGNVYIVGWGGGPISLGDGTWVGPGSPGFIVKLRPDGGLGFVSVFFVYGVTPRSIVVDSMDRPIVLGTFERSLNLGPLGSFAAGPGGADLLLVGFEAVGVSLRSASQFGDPDRAESNAALAIGPSGDLWIASTFSSPTGSDSGIAVERIDSMDAPRWRRSFVTTSLPALQLLGLDVGPTGAASIVSRGQLDVGAGEPTREDWAARFDADGMLDWQQQFSSPAIAIAVDARDHTFVAGSFLSPAPLDVVPCSLSETPAGGPALYEIDSTGARVSSAGFLNGWAHAVDARGGRIALAGRASGPIDHGCGLHAAGGGGPFVIVLEAP